MSAVFSRFLRFALGVILCAIGGLGSIALIAWSIESSEGWAFLLVPISVVAGAILLARGSRFIAHSIDG